MTAHNDPLASARIRAVYVILAAILFLVVYAQIVPDSSIDLGVFGMLVGALLALLGLGSVIRIIGIDRPK